jgi:D-methionine transport system ATP-binding protein
VLEILLSGDGAKEPVLTGVARHFDIDLNVLAGSVETLGGQQFGHLRVQLASNADYRAVLDYLRDRGISAKLADTAADDAELAEFAPADTDFAAETGDAK